MWLGAYQADRHELYFARSRGEVETATRSSAAFQGVFHGDANIFDPDNLAPGTTHFWRVDVVRAATTGRVGGLPWIEDAPASFPECPESRVAICIMQVRTWPIAHHGVPEYKMGIW